MKLIATYLCIGHCVRSYFCWNMYFYHFPIWN